MAPQTRGNAATAQRQEAAKKQKTGHHSEPKASKPSDEQKPHRSPTLAPSAAVASLPADALANLLVASQTPTPVSIAPDVAKQKNESLESHRTPSALPRAPTSNTSPVNIARFSDVAKVKLALSGQKYFPDVPIKVRDMVASVANECLSLEHSARHPFQHKMLEVVDTAMDSAKRKVEDELQERNTFVETAQQKQETLLRAQTEKQQELEKKQTELTKSIEDRSSAAERLKTAQEAVTLACTATLTAKRTRDACEQECMKIKDAYERFTKLEDQRAEIKKQADAVAALLPTLKIMGVDGATVDALPSVVVKPAGERSSGESMSLIVIEGTFAKRIRDDSASLNKCEVELKQKETTEASAKEDAQKRTEELAACGEAVKTKEAEKKDHEQQVSAATSDVKKHEVEMGSGESKLQSKQADVDAFLEIQTKYLLLKNPIPPPASEPEQTPQPAPAAGA